MILAAQPAWPLKAYRDIKNPVYGPKVSRKFCGKSCGTSFASNIPYQHTLSFSDLQKHIIFLVLEMLDS
jgi:hypothetical protein